MVLTKSAANSQVGNDRTRGASQQDAANHPARSRGAPNHPRRAARSNLMQSAHQDPPSPQHDPNVVQLDQLALDAKPSIEEDVVSSKCRPKAPLEVDSEKVPSDMPSLFTIPPGSAPALPLKDIQYMPLEEDSNSPLYGEILRAKVSCKFTPPQIALYDGKTDLVNHVHRYTASLLGSGVSEQAQCLLFLGPLTGNAADWERESLRDWYDRFFKALIEVEGLTQRDAMATFQRGLRSKDLTKSLIITSLNSFADIFACARKFMVVKESASVWKKKEHVGEERKDHPKEDDSEGRKQSSWIEKFMPLNAPKAVVLNEIERLGIWIPPQVKKKEDIGNDSNSCCRYHKAWGHDTEDYKTLKVDIERLIQASHLRSFIRKGGREDRARSPRHGWSPWRREEPDQYHSERGKFCKDFASGVIP
ncbi:hypothetical protein CRG98_000211 [Punica granatum]|uniref:Retrotransposon gag domain-containing protein n=1 Tax=Punica granatum TaxID=22663 RepID=A0A2I0LG37_PUNGR|nr:hypothetical protein CRG98_000211 [Punica granatum]